LHLLCQPAGSVGHHRLFRRNNLVFKDLAKLVPIARTRKEAMLVVKRQHPDVA
jgi:hypothetical protein